ncbi:MAG TPA: hypothetical protein VGQ11_00415 [Candidatus Acidoferrales bacterium]|jgi:Na+-driven multidrug efflux pump|nr:hypothetical protein [Candidatus Acidoferrales bacterium]
MSARAYAISHPIAQTQTLGTLWVAYGILRLILAIGLVFFSTTATLMFGSLLNRVPDPFTLMDIFHFLYIVAVVWFAVSGVLALVAGLALRGNRDARRSWILAAILLAIPDIPFGAVLGVYTLVVLLR